MDPDKCLAEIRELEGKITAWGRVKAEEGTNFADMMEVAGYALRLAEAIGNLDEWLTKGGFPPRAWKKGG